MNRVPRVRALYEILWARHDIRAVLKRVLGVVGGAPPIEIAFPIVGRVAILVAGERFIGGRLTVPCRAHCAVHLHALLLPAVRVKRHSSSLIALRDCLLQDANATTARHPAPYPSARTCLVAWELGYHPPLRIGIVCRQKLDDRTKLLAPGVSAKHQDCLHLRRKLSRSRIGRRQIVRRHARELAKHMRRDRQAIQDSNQALQALLRATATGRGSTTASSRAPRIASLISLSGRSLWA